MQTKTKKILAVAALSLSIFSSSAFAQETQSAANKLPNKPFIIVVEKPGADEFSMCRYNENCMDVMALSDVKAKKVTFCEVDQYTGKMRQFHSVMTAKLQDRLTNGGGLADTECSKLDTKKNVYCKNGLCRTEYDIAETEASQR